MAEEETPPENETPVDETEDNTPDTPSYTEVDPIEKSSEYILGTDTTLPKLGEEDVKDVDSEKEKNIMTLSDQDVKKTLKTGDAFDDVEVSKGSTDEIEVEAPTAPTDNAGQVGSTTKVSTPSDMKAASGTLTKEIGNITGELSAGATAVPATGVLDEKATVKYQMANLMSDIEEGKPLPAWASPAVRKVQAVMQSRGMGASSMASAAMIQAVMESGMPIAAADAQAHATIQLKNLTNKQATALQNAATVASMDTANLNARMTAAVNNARNFLAIDTANLTNDQQTRTVNYQADVQAALTDAAADNARKQFNAKNDLQMEEFFAELGSQVDSANANRVAAMEQFNVSEANAMKTYNQSMMDSRERFNATAKFAIDQSNVTWRRDVNTANTATQNETNRINVQNEYNASQNAMNNLWQKYRDNATFNFNKIESGVDREHAIGLMALENSYNQDLLDEQEKKDLIGAVAKFVANWTLSST